MKHKVNGKIYDIPDDELDKLVEKLDISLGEAIDLWLEDNDIIEPCEEVKELEKKAKDNKITATIHQAHKFEKREKKKVERKPDEVKEMIISQLAEMLKGVDDITDVTIENVGKLITFKLKDDSYKIDLIRQRKPKGAK